MADSLTLGEAGVPHDDHTYDGAVTDTGSASVSMDFVRAKYLEFQAMMNALDRAYQACNAAYFASDPPDEELYAWLMDYEANAAQIRALAQTLNAGAATINALGGRVPSLSLPATLGAVPLVIGGALLVALSSVAAWIAYARGKVAGADAIITRIQAMPDNATKPEIVAAAGEVRRSMAELSENSLSRLVGSFGELGGVLKLAIVAGLGYLAWRSFGDVLDR